MKKPGAVFLLGAALAASACATEAVSPPRTSPPGARAGLPAPAVPGAAAPVVITRSVVCTAISDREPVGAQTPPIVLGRDVEQVYFWNEAEVASPPRTLTHVWSADGKVIRRIPLRLSAAHMRTWSLKSVFPGAWTVSAVDEAGNVLATAQFTVR